METIKRSRNSFFKKKLYNLCVCFLEAVRLPNAWMFETLHGSEFAAQAR